MYKTLTLALALTLILALASCSKSPAPATSFISTKYLGIDHIYTCKGLQQDTGMYVINGDETGSVNKLQIQLTHVSKGTYALGSQAGNNMTFWVAGDTYSSAARGATGSITINKIDSTIYNIHANFTSHLANVSDTTDYLDVSGEFNIKYQY
ncbi:MAG: hypothetical protein JST83_10990 [Bacteroidetes bacterium]|nr:hypothetical protein [Bacteroidota bacterium]